jgi:hypothetical protein
MADSGRCEAKRQMGKEYLLMESLIVGLVITTVGGMGFFAYNQPILYLSYFQYLPAISFVLMSLANAYNITIITTHTELIPFIEIDKSEAARTAT